MDVRDHSLFKAILKAILDDPGAFVANVLGGVADGFSRFFGDLPNTLPNKLFDWLTAGIHLPTPPKSLAAADLGPWLLDLFHLNWDGIQQIVAGAVGPGNVALLAQAYAYLQASWEKVGTGGEVFRAVNDLLTQAGDGQGLTPEALAEAGIDALVNMAVAEIGRQAPKVILAKLTPGGAVLSTVYNGLTWALDTAGKARGLTGLVGDLAAKVGTLASAKGPAAVDAAKRDLSDGVKGFLDGLVPFGLTFAASQMNLGSLPARAAAALARVQGLPRAKVAAAVNAAVGKAKVLLGLRGADGGPYQGLVGAEVTVTALGHTARLWVAQHNGKAAVMRSVDGGPAAVLDLGKDLPKAVEAGKRSAIDAALGALAADGGRAIAAERAATAKGAAAAATRAAGAELVAAFRRIGTDLQAEIDALVAAGATCFFGQACFAAGTPLRTPGGSRAIETFAVGDWVLTRDERDPHAAVVARRVEELFTRTGEVWHLWVGGRKKGVFSLTLKRKR